MALYEVYHHHAVSDADKPKLAKAITSLHCERFAVPSMFVTLRFRAYEAEQSHNEEYVGGVFVSRFCFSAFVLLSCTFLISFVCLAQLQLA